MEGEARRRAMEDRATARTLRLTYGSCGRLVELCGVPEVRIGKAEEVSGSTLWNLRWPMREATEAVPHRNKKKLTEWMHEIVAATRRVGVTCWSHSRGILCGGKKTHLVNESPLTRDRLRQMRLGWNEWRQNVCAARECREEIPTRMSFIYKMGSHSEVTI